MFDSTLSKLFLLSVSIFCYQLVASLPASYDQRQNGELNVAVHLKDVQVLALVDGDLLDDYVDYNYAYDYADFTIKPITKPTSAPSGSSTSVKPWNTWPTHPPTSSSKAPNSVTAEIPASSSPSSISSSSPSSSLSVSSSSTEKSPDVNNEIISTSTTENSLDSLSSSSSSQSSSENDDLLAMDRNDQSSTTLASRCPAGYSLDAKGRCRKQLRRRVSFLPITVKLAPKFTEEGSASKDLRVASWISTRL